MTEELTDEERWEARKCPLGRGNAHYNCRFCSERQWLHRGDEDCGCSTLRQKTTQYATLCNQHAAAIDVLTADTPVGRVHRALVHDANCAGRPTSD